MINIGIAQWCLECNRVEAIYRAADLGLSAIQVDAGEIKTESFIGNATLRKAYQEAVQNTGIEITAIAINILNDYSLNNPAGSYKARKVWDMIQRTIDTAALMDVELVFIPSFENGEIRTEQELMRTAEVLYQACVYAENRAISLASENTLGVKGNRKLLTLVNKPNLQILIDSQNPVLWGYKTSNLIKELFPYICNQVHAKDGINGIMGNATLGTGQSDFADTAKTLQSVGFSGYLILENEYEQNAEIQISHDLAIICSLFLQEIA